MPHMKKDGLVIQLDNLVREHPDFEALPESALDGYCFRFLPNSLVERQHETEVQTLLDLLNEEIVETVQHNGFAAVEKIRVLGRAAIQVSFSSDRAPTNEADKTFDAIARWGRLINKKLSFRYETDMEAKLCSSGSHSSATEVSVI